MRMFLDRHGFLEETWFTFSFSPITDESGGVGGLFHPVTELTGQMLSERRTRTVHDLAIRLASARTSEEALQISASVFADANLDVPFVVLYLVDDSGTRARRVAVSGISPEAAGGELVDLDRGGSPWSIAEAFRSGETLQLDDARARIAEPVGPYPEVPKHAFVLPIRLSGHPSAKAIMVAGVSPRLMLGDSYRVFYELAASAVGMALANASALEHERRKADALAELDRAKTAFFSNVSHEFRTPLTLMLGPLEDELGEGELGEDELGGPAARATHRRERLETVHRNALRLLRLVNALLDFSRIEAGRLQAAFEPVDLATETIQLAGVFRSAIEKVGLSLTIDCPALPEPVYLDREMWEKIVLNLLSNALKHTSMGGITVAQHWGADRVTLRVIDTGVGIAEHELPRVFERFHRVQGAWSRSHEGTGIGLALVRELARAHGGDVEIASREAVGTVVTVSVKTGSAHLPTDRVRPPTAHMPGRAAAGFVEEALHWLPDPPSLPGAGASGLATSHDTGRPRVVWADDNADMRGYVARLLADQFEVIAVPDGAAALQAILAHPPELVLSDVMMPNLDGFGLLAALRADARTCSVPVILLSARAGAEAASEGMDAGADDYVTKPFTARELLARVRTHITLGRVRRVWARDLERANQELEAFSYSVSHDLRAPVRAIDGFGQMLLGDHGHTLDDAGRELVDRILANAGRMTAIIDDLLALSQVGRGELRRDTVNLTAITRRIVDDLRVRDPSRIVEVSVRDGLATTGDGRLVTIALENLLSNAWKFTSKRPRAEIVIDREADGVFTVRDNGAGFDMAYSERLFEPFQRLHGTAEFAGTGIGLAIVRRIIERHGGRVWAQGVVDAGATVRFTLEPGAG
jgi:signal transduction histidine kinase